MKAQFFMVRFFLLWSCLVLGADLFADQAPVAPSQPVEKREDDSSHAAPVPGAEPAAPVAPAVEQQSVQKAHDVPPKVEAVASPGEEPAPLEKKLRKIGGGQAGLAIDGNSRHGGNDRVRILDDNEVPSDVTVGGNAVAVLGDLTVKGEVMHDAVAVLGDVVVNGTVHHNVVAVMGDLTLGPNARVEGNVTIVGGDIHRDPTAFIGGQIHVQPIDADFDALHNWWGKTLRVGRPLAIGAHLGWLWIVTGFSVAFYALLALIFPKTVCLCGDKLVEQPGLTILAAILGLLALPVLFILLCFTLIGIPVALFLLPLGIVLAMLFGKAAIYTLVGRKISRDRLHPAIAAITGALIFIVLYLLPYAGLLLSVLVALIGFGCVVLTLFSPKINSAVAQVAGSQSVAEPSAEPSPIASPLEVPAMPSVAGVAAMPPLLPSQLLPVISAATLPRAGFWIRVAAAFLDAVLVGVMIGIFQALFHSLGFHPGEAFPLWVALYSVIMWRTKATTIGGVICGLRVVRLDDRPVDWGVALVRALGGFLSLAVAGLGFVWVAFDDEKQSWHDKIAGTTIVRVPKGTSLL